MAVRGEMFSRLAKVAVTVSGGSDIAFATTIDNFTISQGNKPIEVIPTVGGGRLVGFNPEEPTEIDITMYPIGVDFANAQGFTQVFQDELSNADGTDPLEESNSRNREVFRVAILFTDDTTATDAAGATSASSNSFRFVAANGYMTEHNFEFSDKRLQTTAKFMFPPFTKDGSANYRTESAQDTESPLTSLASYTYSTDGSSNW